MNKKIIVLIIGIAGIAWAVLTVSLVMLFLDKTKDNKQISQAKNTLSEENASLKEKLSQAEEKIRDLEVTISDAKIKQGELNRSLLSLMAQAEKLKGESEKFKTRYKTVASSKTELLKKIDDLAKEKDTVEGKLAALENEPGLPKAKREIEEIWNKLSAFVEKSQPADNAQTQEILAVKRALDAKAAELDSIKLTIEKSRKQIEELSRAGVLSVELASVAIESNPLSGKVLAIDRAYNFVAINLGEADGLKEGRAFTILRKGKPVGKVRVFEVRKNISAATIENLQKGAYAKEGDLIVSE